MCGVVVVGVCVVVFLLLFFWGGGVGGVFALSLGGCVCVWGGGGLKILHGPTTTNQRYPVTSCNQNRGQPKGTLLHYNTGMGAKTRGAQ